MRGTNNKLFWVVVCALLMTLLWAPACSDDSGSGLEVPEKRYAELLISLGSFDRSPMTRALPDDFNDIVLDPDSADSDYEHRIAKWWILILKQDEEKAFKFDQLISNTPLANNEDEDSRTDIRVELEVGATYKFYAYANLDGLAQGNEVIAWLEDINTNTPETEIQGYAVSLKEMSAYNGGTNPTAYIPMSSYGYTKTITENTTANLLEIPLIRLLGKVEIVVTNASGKDVTISKLQMGKFRKTGNIFLLPYDVTADEDKWNLLVRDTETGLLNPSFPGNDEEKEGGDYGVELTDDKDDKGKIPYVEGAENEKTFSFYVNETAQENQEDGIGDMTLLVEVEEVDTDEEPKETNFFFVRRNDLLRFPILVSNAKTTVAFEQKHMPIGGVPTKYTFDPGIVIPERTFVTDHAGEVTIPYVLEELGEEWTLSYYEGGNWTSGDRYCSAVLVNNRDGLLQKPETTLELGTDIPWLDKSDGEYGFIFDTKEDRSGSFTITLDERFYAAEATIKLTLVARNSAGQTIVLPYTLIIKNNGKAKEETNDDTN